MSTDHHRVTPEGQALGQHAERSALAGILALGIQDLRCASCAFRAGTVPNGCLQTQLDALKAVVDGVPFHCHAPNDGRACTGWIGARAVHATLPLPAALTEIAQRWTFSPPDED